MIDCLIIGHNDIDFGRYIDSLKAIGEDSGDYKNRSLSFIYKNGKVMRAMDVINHFVFGDDWDSVKNNYYNGDFLQPAIANLGSYLHRHGNLDFSFINNFNREKSLLREKLISNDILTVVVTTTFYISADPVLDIISFVRRFNKKAKIVLGGPYISSLLLNDHSSIQGILKYLGADYYIDSSEGEKSLLSLIKSIKENIDPNTVPNLFFNHEGNFKYSFKEVEKNELQDNMVIWDLFKPYINQFSSIRTAKSCPFNCAFCGFPTRAGKYVYYNLEFLEEELDKLHALGVKTISYIDDTFNVPKERFKEILRLKIRKKYNFKWNSFFRCDFGDDETIALMKESGCEGVFLGIESGSDKVLKLMNKSLRASHVRRMVPLLREAGILTYASLIVGFPGETEDTFKETMQLISEVKPDFFRVQLWYCDKSTPIWKEKDKYNIVGDSFNWSHKTMTVKQASTLMEEAFLTQSDSTWLPEDSFEFWSIFYLGRKGYSVEQLKNFSTKFRVIMAKQKMLPHRFSDENIKDDIIELRQIVLNYEDWLKKKGQLDLAGELNPTIQGAEYQDQVFNTTFDI